MRMRNASHGLIRYQWGFLAVVAALVLTLSPGPANSKAAKSLVDVNSATMQELEAVKGIGPATAKKIVASRPYASLDELSKAGLSPKQIKGLQSYLMVGKAAPPTPGAPPAPEAKHPAIKHPAAPAGTPVDLNSADEKAIEGLSGIGPALAKKIIAGRPYQSLDDLSRVKGLSKAKLEALRDKVTVGPVKPEMVPAKPAGAPSPAAPGPAAAPAPAAPPAAKHPVTPPKEAAGEKAAAPAPKLAPGEKININTAAKEELDKLPGIGPVKAQAIVEGRPYEKPEDIMKIKGIKEGEFNKIKDYITVR